MTASPQADCRNREGRGRLFKVWCVYALLGPLFGAVVGWVELFIGLLFVPIKFSPFPGHAGIGDFFLRVNTALSVIPFAMIFGLLWGFSFSALTGLAIVVMMSAGKRIGLVEALSIASSVYLMLFAGMYAYASLTERSSGPSTLPLTMFRPLVLVRYPQFAILPVLVATAICWSMVRKWKN